MKITTLSVSQTLKLGKNIAAALSAGDIVLLSGSLGAGKTVLAKGIAQGLGIDKDQVISPTFVFLRLYAGRHLLQHFDFYRIKKAQDIYAMGCQEYFYSEGISVIEWPERLKFLLPKEFLKIKLISKGPSRREFVFAAKGQRYKKLLRKINANIGD